MIIAYVTRNLNNNSVTIQTKDPDNTYTIDDKTADDLAEQILQSKYHTDVITHLNELYDPKSYKKVPQNDIMLCNDITSLYTVMRLKGDMTWDNALYYAIDFYKERIERNVER